MSAAQKCTAVLGGIAAALATFIAVEIAAGVLSVIVRLVEQYTKSFYLGEEWNNWLGVVFLLLGHVAGNLPRASRRRSETIPLDTD